MTKSEHRSQENLSDERVNDGPQVTRIGALVAHGSRRTAKLCVALATVLALAGAAPSLMAAPSDDARSEARERFDRGLRLVNQNDFEGAIAEFERAQQLAPHPMVLFNLGLVFAAASRPVEAVDTFDQLLAAPGDFPRDRLLHVQEERARQLALIAELEVKANVEGASVALDGIEVGRTPLAAPLRVASGSHIIGVTARGHAPLRRRVSVAGQTRQLVQLDLVPFDGEPAHLVVQTSVPDAEVLVDGEVVGRTPLSASLALKPGQRSIEVRRPGYVTAQHSVNLGQGSRGKLDVELSADPSALAREGGMLTLDISEPDAVIFVDGVARGAYAGPLQLAHGVHRLRVERSEFLPFERNVSVPRGSQSRVSIELEPTADKRAAYRSGALMQQTWGIIAAGAGAAVTLGSIGFVVWNLGEEKSAEKRFDTEADKQRAGGECDRQAGLQTRACIQALDLALDDLESVRAREKYGWIGTGAGLAIAGLGVTLLLVNDDPDRYEPRPESDVYGRVQVVPFAWLAPGAGAAGISGRF